MRDEVLCSYFIERCIGCISGSIQESRGRKPGCRWKMGRMEGRYQGRTCEYVFFATGSQTSSEMLDLARIHGQATKCSALVTTHTHMFLCVPTGKDSGVTRKA
jgi:hypothetical protein